GLIMPLPVTTTRRRSRSRTWSSVLAVLDRLQRGDLRRFYQSGSGEERKRDRDERQLESRETDVTQVADPHEITIGQPPLTPERRVRENRRENDVRKQLRAAGLRGENATVEWRGPRAGKAPARRLPRVGAPGAEA